MESVAAEEQLPKIYQTTATEKIFALDKRIRAVAGGTSASKTISILVWLIKYSQVKYNKLIDVVAESYPHLEAGAMADFQNIMITQGYWKRSRWNDTKHQYTFETGTRIRFRSLELSSAHGPRRDVLFINEANNIPLTVFDQLEPRTREIVWMDWNPSVEFWFYTDVLEQRKADTDFITLTYKDNEALLYEPGQQTIRSIESRRGNKNWWLVYGEGKLGEVEGRVYTGWQIINEIPHEARLVRYCVDFGWFPDPLAVIAIYYYNGGYIFDEILFGNYIPNSQAAETILNQEQKAITIADCAEPKSIDEMKHKGVNIIACRKGPDRKMQVIHYIQDQRISVTARSTNIIREYRGYLLQTDKDGKLLNIPQEFDDHAMDAINYGMDALRAPTIRPRQQVRQVSLGMPR